MARDRTARRRIQIFLATNGPVEDAQGQATKLLKDAVGYQGSPVAFIQLLAAMERDGELTREVRGKRTYRIGVAASVVVPSAAAAGGAGRVLALGARADQPREVATDAGSSGGLVVDYDLLARSLLRQLVDMLDGREVRDRDDAGRAAAADGLDPIVWERDEYARRLERAHAKLDELRAEMSRHGVDAPG